MTRPYRTLGEMNEARFRELIANTGGPAVEETPTQGIMGSRFSRGARQVPVQNEQPTEQSTPSTSFLEAFARALGMNADDPEEVAGAVTTASTTEGAGSVDEFTGLTPLEQLLGRDQTRAALGTDYSYTPRTSDSDDPNVRLFDTIVSGESVDYNTVYSGSAIEPPKPITEMTVEEVRAWQDRSVAAGADSSAAGRFQIIRSTMDELIEQGVLSPDDVFNEETQNRAYEALLERRGFSRFRNAMQNASSDAQRRQIAQRFQMNLAREFASVPVPYDVPRRGVTRGQSYYQGVANNRAAHSADSFLNILMEF